MIALDLADCNPPEGEILLNVAVAFSIWEGVYIKCRGEVSVPFPLRGLRRAAKQP
jgi:hypothetical protein